MRRREFLQVTAAGLGGVLAARVAPAFVVAGKRRPAVPFGVQSGDPDRDGVTIWSASDRPARMWIETARSPDFRSAVRRPGPDVLVDTAFAGKLRVALPPGEHHYRVWFESLADGARSEAVNGTTRVPGLDTPRNVKLLWSGDTAGQGFGISKTHGGMQTYAAMASHRPDAFIHCGDLIYADNPLPETIALPDGSEWRNLVTPEKAKVAETLDEFRGNYRYNLLDENVRSFNATTAQIVQWDDHETVNNWFPGEVLDDPRYSVQSVDLLAARARRAFQEWTPTRNSSTDPRRIFRRHSLGPLVEVFVLDLRSYRGPNGPNDETERSPRTRFLGDVQLAWLKSAMSSSRATWKIVASDMPLGLVVRDGDHFENGANGDGPPRGRELEIAELLRGLRDSKTSNVVWVTADVHYTAAHHYHPDRARFRDFDPFWEFVSGPLHAGTFGPNPLDDTFGPKTVFQKAPPPGEANLSPAEGLQFFGEIVADAKDRSLTVRLRDRNDRVLHTQRLESV